MMCWELHIAEHADSQHWNVIGAPDDPKFPFCHVSSLRRSVRRSRADNINLHHYPTYDLNCNLGEIVLQILHNLRCALRLRVSREEYSFRERGSGQWAEPG